MARAPSNFRQQDVTSADSFQIFQSFDRGMATFSPVP
jgi:hypothetical protein